ncbi:MAG: hypothetical protein WAZ19_04195 [Anaerolineae bacterium]
MDYWHNLVVKEEITTMSQNQPVESGRQNLTAVIAAFAALCYLVLFLVITVAAFYLAPYEAVPPQLRPPEGTWQRGINDFFSGTPGVLTPALLVVGTSLVLLFGGLRRSGGDPRAKTSLLTKFGVLNLIISIGMVLGFQVLSLLPAQLTASGGYNQTLKFIVWSVLIIAVLLIQQARIARR